MTTKTLVKHSQGLVALTDNLQAQNGQLVQTPAFIEAVQLAGQLQRDLDEFWGSIQLFLEVNKVEGAKGEWGHVSLATRRTLVAGKSVKPRFLKKVVATDQVRAWQALHAGRLPAGITEKSSKYLNKKVNLK